MIKKNIRFQGQSYIDSIDGNSCISADGKERLKERFAQNVQIIQNDLLNIMMVDS